MKDIYYAANTFNNFVDKTKTTRQIEPLENEMLINQTSRSRIIGVTIETRPDCIGVRELVEFRTLGVTRVQLGVQHTNDRVLRRINRQCNSHHTIKAIKLLKDCGFKVDIHIMPNLPKPLKEGVDCNKEEFTLDDIDQSVNMVEEDRKMFNEFLFNPDYYADQWKIYPCEIVPWTKFKDEYERGVYKPYADQVSREWNELHELLINVKSKVPRWVRLNRIIRDIPKEYIIGGPNDGSMRQYLQQEMKKRGLVCNCIRCREVKKQKVDISSAKLFVERYSASDGDEYFITFETIDRKVLFGFLRLRLSNMSGKYTLCGKERIVFNELVDCALIRELHIYGQTTSVQDKNDLCKVKYQHCGFGKKLVYKAIEITQQNNFSKIAVISGEGVKKYYEKFGFRNGNYYMTLNINNINYNIVNYMEQKIMKIKWIKDIIVNKAYNIMSNSMKKYRSLSFELEKYNYYRSRHSDSDSNSDNDDNDENIEHVSTIETIDVTDYDLDNSLKDVTDYDSDNSLKDDDYNNDKPVSFYELYDNDVRKNKLTPDGENAVKIMLLTGAFYAFIMPFVLYCN